MPIKVHRLKAMAFPVAMYGCESWTIKKAEHQRIDAFELWCWRRLLRVLWTAKRSNQSILKEVNPEYSLEGLMLKLQSFGHRELMQRVDSLKKTLMLWKTKGRRGGWTEDELVGGHHRFSGQELSKLQEIVNNKKAWDAAVHGVGSQRVGQDWATEQDIIPTLYF